MFRYSKTVRHIWSILLTISLCVRVLIVLVIYFTTYKYISTSLARSIWLSQHLRGSLCGHNTFRSSLQISTLHASVSFNFFKFYSYVGHDVCGKGSGTAPINFSFKVFGVVDWIKIKEEEAWNTAWLCETTCRNGHIDIDHENDDLWLNYWDSKIDLARDRVESGSHLLTHMTHRAIQMWPRYDPLVTHMRC